MQLIPYGDSYYFAVTGTAGDRISVSVKGTDGFPSAAHNQVGYFEGVGSLSTPVIPRGEPGVVDFVTVKNFATEETQIFTFKFR